MNKILLIFLLMATTPVWSQDLSLFDVVQKAQEQSILAKQAENRKLNSYWQYRLYQSNYKPQLALSGQIPSFTRAFTPVIQPDGTTAFQPVSISNSSLTLSLSQSIAATGGQLFVNSQLQRFDDYNRNITRWNGLPFTLGFSQPLFAFNALRWDKKTEPLRYEESLKRYAEETQFIALEASNRFFTLLLAQVSLRIATLNQSNNDTIYRIAQGRFSLGKIAENELLQLELNLIRSQQQVTQAQLDLETATLALNTFLGQPKGGELKLIEPNSNIPEFTVDVDMAIAQAKQNRQQYVRFQRQKLEAERDVARAKGDSGINMELFGGFGLSQAGDKMTDVYQNPVSQQNLSLGFRVPIVDWGRQQAQVKTALANRDLVNSTIEQEEINFEQEIYVKVRQFPILRDRLKAAIKADEVAMKRHEIAQQRYMMSKISITDLNIALQEKDQAKQQYLEAMRTFWNAYYELRTLTLYDFETGQSLKIE
jgi:outer membrane protein TolC